MNCPRKRHSLFSDLGLPDLEVFEKNRYVVNYRAGETLYKEGTKPPGLICLNTGKVKISLSQRQRGRTNCGTEKAC